MENKLDFEYGDLYTVCSKGHKSKMAENIPVGLEFRLFNKHEQFIEISCPECDKEYKLRLQLFPAENPPVKEEGIEDAVIVDEDNEEMNNEVEDIDKEIENELQESTAERQDI